jgi:hypothetical protein
MKLFRQTAPPTPARDLEYDLTVARSNTDKLARENDALTAVLAAGTNAASSARALLANGALQDAQRAFFAMGIRLHGCTHNEAATNHLNIAAVNHLQYVTNYSIQHLLLAELLGEDRVVPAMVANLRAISGLARVAEEQYLYLPHASREHHSPHAIVWGGYEVHRVTFNRQFAAIVDQHYGHVPAPTTKRIPAPTEYTPPLIELARRLVSIEMQLRGLPPGTAVISGTTAGTPYHLPLFAMDHADLVQHPVKRGSNDIAWL